MSLTKSALPLYAQIKEVLQQEIDTTMKPGDLLSTEAMLEKRFKVSRITIRRALDELEAEGIIVREQGRGTFVREPSITMELPQLVSWTAAMKQLGYSPQTMSCTIELAEPPREISTLLHMEREERAIRIRRLRYANNEPFCLMTNYVREQLLPQLVETGLVEGSLFATLNAHQITPVHAEDKVEARAATEWEASQLQIQTNAPLLQVKRVSFDAAKMPLVVDVVANRADKYSYTITY